MRPETEYCDAGDDESKIAHKISNDDDHADEIAAVIIYSFHDFISRKPLVDPSIQMNGLLMNRRLVTAEVN